MSSTGDSAWRAPTAIISARICSATDCSNEVSQVAARPIAWGNWVASRAQKPPTASSWMTAGMPNRVCSTRNCWIWLCSSASPSGRSPVDAAMRVTCPVPVDMSSVAASTENPLVAVGSPGRTSCVDQTQPSWASFSSSVMWPIRSSTRCSIDSPGSR